MHESNRIVYCEDALSWLESAPITAQTSFVASLPDISEFSQFTLTQWKEWFIATASIILSKCPDEGVVVFYQSDIKHEGTWVDKGYLCQKAAEKMGHDLLWHKLVCRSPAGTISFGRPAYSHLLCFSKGVRADVAKSSPDVLPELGDKTWERGMGLTACQLVAKFIAEQTTTKTLINPFCGHGSMLAMGNAFQLDTIGIERSPKRAEKARELRVSSDFKRWE